MTDTVEEVDFIGGVKLPISTQVTFPFDSGLKEVMKIGRITGKSPRSTAELMIATNDGKEYYVHKCFIRLCQTETK